MESQDLWPNFDFKPIRQPKTILQEQASFLMQKTNNILSTEIITTQVSNYIFQHFFVLAPALNNYKYELLRVRHTVMLYPLNVVYKDMIYSDSHTEEDLLDTLRILFNADEVIQIISSLVSQSMAK